MLGLFRKWRDDQSGSALVLVSVAMAALIGLGAISVDVGHLYAERSRLSAIADAAALAGAQYLPGDEAAAIETAFQYVELNGIDRSVTDVAIIDAAKRRVQVSLHGDVELTFAGVLHLYEKSLLVSSTAIKAPINAMRGVIPLGVELPNGIVFGQDLILKAGGGDGAIGNYDALSLGGTGASSFELNLQRGYASLLAVGQTIKTETGNMVGPTQRGLRDRLAEDREATIDTVTPTSPRLIIVPIVSFDGATGRSSVTVTGFAAFFLEEMVSQDEVRGQFVRVIKPGEINESWTGPDYGLSVVKLTR